MGSKYGKYYMGSIYREKYMGKYGNTSGRVKNTNNREKKKSFFWC
jgi:hypothetical protein